MTAGARLRSLIAGAAAALMATGLISLGAVQAAPSSARGGDRRAAGSTSACW